MNYNIIMKKALVSCLIVLLIITILPTPSLAHPPSGIQMEYDIGTQKLNVTITHNTGNPGTHYIYKVTVKRNNDLVIDEQYTSQPTSSVFTYTYDVAAADGDILEAYAECNQGGSQTEQLTVVEPDVTLPGITITEPVEGGIFTFDTIYVNGTAADNKDVDRVEVKINNGNWMPAAGTGTWSIEVTLAEGQNTIQAKAIDTSDNEATDVVNVTYNEPVDTTPPVIVISSPMEGQVFQTDDITVVGTAVDDNALDRIEVRLNDDPWQLASGTESWNIDITLAEGNNSIHARAWDTSGNNVTRAVSVTFDSTEPVENIPPTIIISYPSEGQELGSSTVTVQGNASDNAGLAKVEVSLNDGGWQLCEGLGSWNIDIILDEGSNEITARATDSSGNSATDSINITLTIPDMVSPVISIISHQDNEVVNEGNITISGTAYDRIALKKVEVRSDQGQWTIPSGLANWSIPLSLSEGTNVIQARVVDALGNNATVTISVIYEKDETPGNEVSLDGVISEGEYHFEASFNEGKFVIYWRIEGDHIYMALSARTTGWVSLGIEPTVKMKDADMIIGWVSEGGEAHLLDCFSTGDYGPHPPDTTLGGTDDLPDYGGSEWNGRTILEFRRLIKTADGFDQEFKLDGPMEIIWAVGDDDDYSSGHAGERGSGTLDLRTGESTEKDIPYLWPYHAVLMTIGFILMICAVIAARFFRKKRWWLKVHRPLGGIAAVSVISALVIAIIMVSNSHGSHFSEPHTYIGGLTLLLAISTPILGYMQFKIRNKRELLRNLHRWSGRITLFLMSLTILGGLSLAGVI